MSDIYIGNPSHEFNIIRDMSETDIDISSREIPSRDRVRDLTRNKDITWDEEYIDKHYSLIKYKNAKALVKRGINAKLMKNDYIVGSILNKLNLPTFASTYKAEDNGLYTEDFKGEKKETLLSIRDKISKEDYIKIIIQVLLSLHYAQMKYSFVHYNLQPQKIWIRKSNKDIIFNYYGSPIKVECDYYPIISDFSLSRMEYDGDLIFPEHNDFRKMNFYPAYDVLTLFKRLNISVNIDEWTNIRDILIAINAEKYLKRGTFPEKCIDIRNDLEGSEKIMHYLQIIRESPTEELVKHIEEDIKYMRDSENACYLQKELKKIKVPTIESVCGIEREDYDIFIDDESELLKYEEDYKNAKEYLGNLKHCMYLSRGVISPNQFKDSNTVIKFIESYNNRILSVLEGVLLSGIIRNEQIEILSLLDFNNLDTFIIKCNIKGFLLT